jgi:hypothetical protein
MHICTQYSIEQSDKKKSHFRKLIAAAIILVFAFFAQKPAFCQETGETIESVSSPINFGFESDLNSKYISRGIAYSSGGVSQYSLWASKWNFTGALWANYDFTTRYGASALNELDPSLTFAVSSGKFNFEGTALGYFYPRQPESPSTAELALNVSYDLPYIQPFTTQTLDIKEYIGAYLGEFGLGYSREFKENIFFEAASEIALGSAKYNDAYVGKSKASFEYISIETAITWNLTSNIYLKPHAVISTVLDSDIKMLVDKPFQSGIGLAVGGEF